jgi:ubiquinone/menaquinone biosynthesis C-methylase UbiE
MALPFPDQSIDVVTGLNSRQFAANPLTALKEACQVLRTGGLQVILIGEGIDLRDLFFLSIFSQKVLKPYS